MLLLRDIFTKPIERSIDGVIKADDMSSLQNEFEEYVLTPEISTYLGHFLEAYNDYSKGANGVWISGFFGSGKSHLLKILSFLLENPSLGDSTPLEMFLPKCEGDALLRGALEKAVGIPSTSVLFNIDQKADVLDREKDGGEVLIRTFMRVFDDICGYCGKRPHVAQFERDLDKEGRYQEFQRIYQELSGKPWEKGRERGLLHRSFIDAAYARIAGISEDQAQGILEKYREEYSLSVDDFARMVREYMDSRGKHFRINFFVDELGQYIARDDKMMLKLQSLAESLATACHGRAWLIVTAQEEMENVLGSMEKSSSDNFSRIQARFAQRIKLTSQNVEQVIQKRLLDKNPDGKTYLSDLYQAQKNNLSTLFEFPDPCQKFRNYQGEEDFIASYPFVPYQYPLFQICLRQLSEHNVFEGRHSSVGERSMLGVFQEVGKQLVQEPAGRLASFDLMFEGIRGALKSGAQSAVLRGEKHLDSPLGRRTLKALFLVKYMKEFRPTLRNLLVLLREGFEANSEERRKELEQVLVLLEQQSYIERNGEEYTFLTNEEKDVEEEIKNMDISLDIQREELQKLLFEGVLNLGGKLRHKGINRDFSVARKLDDKLYGKDQELAIHMISPYHESGGAEDKIRLRSGAGGELFGVLPQEKQIMQDLRLYLQTRKYIQQNSGGSHSPSLDRILREKQERNDERWRNLKTLGEELLGKVRFYAYGEEITPKTSAPNLRLEEAFGEMLKLAYPNMSMLGYATFSEKEIPPILASSPGLMGEELTEPEQEMLHRIKALQGDNLRPHLKDLIEHFSSIPYGWPYWGIISLGAHLFAKNKIEIHLDSRSLENPELGEALTNTQKIQKLVLLPQEQIPQEKIQRLRSFYKDFFGSPPSTADPRKLAEETQRRMGELAGKMKEYHVQRTAYSFLQQLEEPLHHLESLATKDRSYFFAHLKELEELLDLKTDLLDPVEEFFRGSQKEIYTEARELFTRQEANLEYLNDEFAPLRQELFDLVYSNPNCFRGGHMQRAKELLDTLRTKLAHQVAEERKAAREKL
ncbi:MAG TPA: BREX system P-loop protein BrxC, partial [Synergistaceae bacterium]|nr:BREX system P-loop protein BrxC [Synergistaceae bacterium]